MPQNAALMKLVAGITSKTSLATATLSLFASGLSSMGCVGLDRPAGLNACLSTPQGCSDNPLPAEPDVAIAKDGPRDRDALAQVDANIPQDVPQPADSNFALDSGRRLDVPADTNGLTETPDGYGAIDLADTAKANPLDMAGPELPNRDLSGLDLPGLDLPVDLPITLDVPPDMPLDLATDPPATESGPGNCITEIIASGYAAGAAKPCSKCNENGNSLAAKCTDMLDCLAPPKTSADVVNCLNSVNGSSVVGDCVKALTDVACPNGY